MTQTPLKPEIEDSAIVMAFDFGTQWIGVAIGQLLTRTATPLKPIAARDGKADWQVLDKLIEQWQPKLFIVGIPLNMDGSDSELAKRARRFARRMENRFAVPWTGMDERLSSFEVKTSLKSSGQKHKGPIDSLAASLILESWLRLQ